jgi:hypothetical protein
MRMSRSLQSASRNSFAYTKQLDCQALGAGVKTSRLPEELKAAAKQDPTMKVIDNASSPSLTVAQLEASYPAYCKALRMLVQDGVSLNKIQRTVCWDRLQLLHTTLPRQYRDPVVHYAMVKRDVDNQQAIAN